MNSSVTFMEKLRKTFDNHPTIRHHMINKNTYVIYWTPLTLQVTKTRLVRENIKFLNSSDIEDLKKHYCFELKLLRIY
jgi:hypothetical protein